MSKLNPLSARKVIQKLKKIGFIKTHQRGSHLYLENGDKVVTIPVHGSKDIPVGTLYNIVVKQAELSIKEFQNL
ncbi:MAG: type II toxin-antitoxin system HicA family toxin [Patescibacteria group bacterium]